MSLPPEREKEIRKTVRIGASLANTAARELLAEIDALRAENKWLCDSRNKLAGESQSLVVERDQLRESSPWLWKL